MGASFVAVPTDRLLATLNAIGEKTTAKGGKFTLAVRGREQVAEIGVAGSPAVILVYTSIREGAQEVRGVGEDAIRIVTGMYEGERLRSLRETVTVKRTAPEVSDRVGAFLERLTSVLREAYKFAKSVPVCDCGKCMALRSGPRGKFWGCMSYPACKGTKKWEDK